MQSRTGSLSIESENMFPIIKKWLYSDHDIFLRELVSNGCDAITKLKKLEIMGEYDMPEDYKAQIQVVVDPDAKTISLTDTGLGMTADEVDEYINQVAFSGATDFLEKYKDKTNEEQIIGHFGLGFYSAFMVSDKVTIDTLSWQKDATPVRWESEGGINFEMSDGTKDTVGTTITLYLSEDSLEFANEYRVREILDKYCSFMPVEIFLSKANAEQEYETIDESELRDDDVVVEHIHEDAKTEEKENENGEKEVVEVSPAKDKVKINKRPVSLSDPNPLWMRHPNECSDEDYKDFYRKVFMDYKEPLFWIHLNMDYPFNLKGILYFPKINTEYDSIEGTIKLYNNQVFIADNIKEVIPEFLLLLKGVIDCPDLPLNVSRSALQNDGFVQKISEYISKKVADKLTRTNFSSPLYFLSNTLLRFCSSCKRTMISSSACVSSLNLAILSITKPCSLNRSIKASRNDMNSGSSWSKFCVNEEIVRCHLSFNSIPPEIRRISSCPILEKVNSISIIASLISVFVSSLVLNASF